MATSVTNIRSEEIIELTTAQYQALVQAGTVKQNVTYFINDDYDYSSSVVMDSAPTANSTNLISSGAVYAALQGTSASSEITTSTDTDITGVLAGNGSKITTRAVDTTATDGSNNLITSGGVYSALQNIDTEITTSTDTNLTGILAGNNGKVTTKTVDSSPTADSTNLVTSGGVATALSNKAPLASPVLTGTPTAPTAAANTNTTQIATTAFVINAIANLGEIMVFKGVVNSNSDLPATHKAGWTYKVGTAGTYVGVACEVGDTILCLSDGTIAANADWYVLQANLDGAVIGAVSSTDNAVARFNGTSGKSIQNSGVIIDDSNNVTIPGVLDVENNVILHATSGDSPSVIFSRDGSLTDWKIIDTSGKLSFQSGTDASTWNERAYFKDNSGNLVLNSGSLTLAASSDNVVLQYDSTLKKLNFVFN